MKRNKVLLCIIVQLLFLAGCKNSFSENMSTGQYIEITQNVDKKVEMNVAPEKKTGNQVETIDYTKLIEMIGGAEKEEESEDSDENFSVVVIDSGIYPHKEFSGKQIICKDFVGTNDVMYDDSGHGTAVAGIIADFTDAQIISCKVSNSRDLVKMDDLNNALQWIVENQQKYHIKVINISLGMTENRKITKCHELCKLLSENGVIIIASVGNSKEESMIYYPADFDEVISVGSLSLNEEGQERISSFSTSWISKTGKVNPTIYSFGENILVKDAYALYKGNPEEHVEMVDTYHEESGTSFACPVVTGLVCQCIEDNPKASGEEILEMLIQGKTIYDREVKQSIPITVYGGRSDKENNH